MDPTRKRNFRLAAALGVAVLLSVALAYTSFNASASDVTAGQLLAMARPGQSYELAGTVTSAHRAGDALFFRIRDPKRAAVSVPVRYTGSVPDPFRVGRAVVVTVREAGTRFVGEPNTLTTKCPSKFRAEGEPDGTGPVLGR